MKMILALFLLAAVFIGANGQDASAANFSNKYCVAVGKECPGNDLGKEIFAATLRQCFVRCNYDPTCQGAFYNKVAKRCQLKTKRCADAELTDNDSGSDLYRLVKGESCPVDRPQYELPKVQFSKKFCAKAGKSCVGHDMYFKPQIIDTLEGCLTKCSKLVTCKSVDYNAAKKKCSPKNHHCEDAELTDDPEMNNVMRLENGKTVCPTDRSQKCLEAEDCAGPISANIIECSDPNSSPVGLSCQCNEGYEQFEDGSCGKTWKNIEFCGLVDKSCSKYDLLKSPLEVAQYMDCPAACIELDTCQSFDLKRVNLRLQCHLKSSQCKDDELIDVNRKTAFSVNTNRLEEGGKCPDDRHLICPSYPGNYGSYRKDESLQKCVLECTDPNATPGVSSCLCNEGFKRVNGLCVFKDVEFCGKAWQKCPGHDLLKEPLVFASTKDCLNECAKFDACRSFDYRKIGTAKFECYLKDYQCKDDELTSVDMVEEPLTYSFNRLEEGGKCPHDRVLVCPDYPSSLGQFKEDQSSDKCILECTDPNSMAAWSTCLCLQGYRREEPNGPCVSRYN